MTLVTSSADAPVALPADAGWFGHPRQLGRLVGVEICERFAYFGLRALLVLYLTRFFLFDDRAAGGIYGAFVGLAYLAPVAGGFVADRVVGRQQAVKTGAILLAVGYLGLCFGGPQPRPVLNYGGQTYPIIATKSHDGTEGRAVITAAGTYPIHGQEDGAIRLAGSTGAVLPAIIAKNRYRTSGTTDPLWVRVMLLSMGLIAVGNGLFKPSISTMVGALYTPDDRRQDAGFTLFYMGNNLGAMASQLAAPLVAGWFGWWAGFGLAALSMVLTWGLLHFDDGRLDHCRVSAVGVSGRTKLLTYSAIVAAVPLAWLLLVDALTALATMSPEPIGALAYLIELPLIGKTLILCFLLSAIGIPIWAFLRTSPIEARRMAVASILIVASAVFWSFFELAGSVLTLFAERCVDRAVLGWTIPSGSIPAFNTFFVVALSPLVIAVWTALGRRGFEPSVPTKFAIALILCGAGFLVLVVGSRFHDPLYRVALGWVVGLYLLHSIGEIFLSPIGLSMIAKLSVPRIVGLMMGVWFLSMAMGNYVGGIVTQMTSIGTVGGEVINHEAALEIYIHTFTIIGGAALGVGLALYAASPILRRWMGGVR